MKIRNGFVSNSSSSSFCIVGKYTELSDLMEKFNISFEEVERMYNEDGFFEWDCDGMEVFPCEECWNVEDASFIVGLGLSGTSKKLVMETFDKFKTTYGEDGELLFGEVVDGIVYN